MGMAPTALGELVSSQGSGTDPGVAKALVTARLAGHTLAAKSDSSAGHSVQLRLPHGTLFGENAVARQVALLAEAGLYPANPYAEHSRHSAALIDGWIEFSANEIQRRLKLLFAAATPEEAAGEEKRLAKSLNVLEERLQSSTYLVNDAISLADIVLVCDLAPAFSKVLDKSVRDQIPGTVRWFMTLAQHDSFKSALGPISMAAAPRTPAEVSSSSRERSANSGSKERGSREAKEGKEGKKPKEGKPKKAPKPALANGSAAGEKKKETKLGVTAKKADDFGAWYQEIVVEAELISYYDVSGCYILRPSAYFIWECIQKFFDAEIKKLDVQNCQFPLFVTKDSLEKEQDHLEGFAAEVAWVTKAGSSDLERPIAIRPTSETVMYPYYAKWIRSHRDLPLRLNQWTNVVRWEFKHPTPFIRTREFLWQEGHTAFATQPEAEEEVFQILDLYAKVYTDLLAVPVKKGRKSELEKFAGAMFTTSVEGFVPATGKGVQGGTSHCLGQNFSKMFNIEFETDTDRTDSAGAKDEAPKKEKAWQNSWGLSTRTIGVMIMVHGDDKGLVMPPRVAPTQVVVIPIPATSLTDAQRQELKAKTQEIVAGLRAQGLRVHTDDRDNYRPGWKYNHWELKGVPLRVELGMKDVEKQSVVSARRDTGAKETIAFADVAARVPALLEQIQADMYQRAADKFEECTESATTWDDFMAALDRKHMVLAPWADEEEVEEQVKKDSSSEATAGAKTLCIPLEQPDLPRGTKCFKSGKPAKNWALWGRSY